MTEQLGLFGGKFPPRGLDVPGKVRWLLEEFAETRDDDNALFIRYLQAFAGFDEQFPGLAGPLLDYLKAVPSFETIRRRRQEAQRLRGSDGGRFGPTSRVRVRRQERDGRGPVR